MPNHLIYKKDNTTRHVHPDAKSTQRLLEKAGFSRVADTPLPEPVEGARPELAEGDTPFNFLPEKVATALREAGITTLDQLAQIDAETLLAIEGIGNATLEKILETTS